MNFGTPFYFAATFVSMFFLKGKKKKKTNADLPVGERIFLLYVLVPCAMALFKSQRSIRSYNWQWFRLWVEYLGKLRKGPQTVKFPAGL
jgi:hypothetical protein